MAIQTLNPNETLSGASLFTITGGSASVHVALADASDATYVQKTGVGVASTVVGFGTYSIGASERIRQVRLKGRLAGGTAASKANLYLGTVSTGVTSTYGASFAAVRGALTIQDVYGPWTGTAPDGNTWSQEKLDAIRAQFEEYRDTTARSFLYRLQVEVDVTTKPTVTVSSPTGTVSSTAKPDVSWAYADTDGDGQSAYQVRVFTAAQYGAGGFDPALSEAAYDSGTIYSSDVTLRIGDYLAATGVHRAYVRVAKTINGSLFFSDWSFSTFTMALTAPTVPTLSASYGSGLNRVSLTLVGANAAGYDFQLFDIQRSDDNGVTYSYIRAGEGFAVGASFTSLAYDYEAPRGVSVKYRARAVAYLASNAVASAWSSISTVAVSNDGLWWLKAVSEPALNAGAINVLEGVGLSVEEDLGVFRAIGRSEPVVVSGTIGGQDGAYTILTTTNVEWSALYPLTVWQDTVLVQDPYGNQKYVRFISRSWRQSGATSVPRREITVGYVEVGS